MLEITFDHCMPSSFKPVKTRQTQRQNCATYAYTHSIYFKTFSTLLRITADPKHICYIALSIAMAQLKILLHSNAKISNLIFAIFYLN